MKVKIFPIFVFFIFVIIFFIFFKGLKNNNIYVPNVDLEKDIPLFKTKILGTNEMVTEKIFENNQFYLMNIWSSWCIPCRDEHTFLMNLKNQKNIKIVGLNYKDNYENAKNFLNELNNPYDIILSDNDGTIAIEWGAYGVPESFLIYNNKIVKKIIGPINSNSIIKIKNIIK
tara:strand:- start:84 stop:599 length:516 start_codon:yes stop_codon:yes gene_type:complete